VLHLYLCLHTAVLAGLARLRTRLDERGQTTAEYALVLLGAVAVAVLVGLWAKQGGKVGRLLDTVFDTLIRQVRSA
jgi:Flp pilus assembly pilin Flp